MDNMRVEALCNYFSDMSENNFIYSLSCIKIIFNVIIKNSQNFEKILNSENIKKNKNKKKSTARCCSNSVKSEIGIK